MNPKKRILIIDDEPDLCLLMKVYFLRKDYGVYISHNILEAFSLAKECRPNVIFISSAACQNPEKDIAKMKAAVPDAEIFIDDYQNVRGV